MEEKVNRLGRAGVRGKLFGWSKNNDRSVANDNLSLSGPGASILSRSMDMILLLYIHDAERRGDTSREGECNVTFSLETTNTTPYISRFYQPSR